MKQFVCLTDTFRLQVLSFYNLFTNSFPLVDQYSAIIRGTLANVWFVSSPAKLLEKKPFQGEL